MKIHILSAEVVVPGLNAFLGGQTYEVDADIGKMLIERGQAEAAPANKKASKNN